MEFAPTIRGAERSRRGELARRHELGRLDHPGRRRRFSASRSPRSTLTGTWRSRRGRLARGRGAPSPSYFDSPTPPAYLPPDDIRRRHDPSGGADVPARARDRFTGYGDEIVLWDTLGAHRAEIMRSARLAPAGSGMSTRRDLRRRPRDRRAPRDARRRRHRREPAPAATSTRNRSACSSACRRSPPASSPATRYGPGPRGLRRPAQSDARRRSALRARRRRRARARRPTTTGRASGARAATPSLCRRSSSPSPSPSPKEEPSNALIQDRASAR